MSSTVYICSAQNWTSSELSRHLNFGCYLATRQALPVNIPLNIFFSTQDCQGQPVELNFVHYTGRHTQADPGSVNKNHRTCRTFPMARPTCLMRDFIILNRIYKAHRTNVWWIMTVFLATLPWNLSILRIPLNSISNFPHILSER